MRAPKMKVCVTLMLGITVAGVQASAAEIDQHIPAPVTRSSLSALPVVNQPYSATKYLRTVKMLADGKQVINNDDQSMRVARDSDGRVLFERKLKCPAGSPEPAWCGTLETILFDPGAYTITFWLSGANAGHAATTIKMTAAQLQDLLTKLALQTSTSDPHSIHPGVTSEDLGQQIYEGMPVTGVRTQTTLPSGYYGNDPSVTISRDVWTSAEMKLVMKVVSTDSRSGEMTSGLEDISRHPEARLFHPPLNYSVSSVNFSGKQSKFAELYLKRLLEAEAE